MLVELTAQSGPEGGTPGGWGLGHLRSEEAMETGQGWSVRVDMQRTRELRSYDEDTGCY